jgi:predicted negative regulator of RcsB-dependent stress response
MRRSSSGQTLTEYLLTLAVLGLVFWAGARAWQRSAARLEQEQAWYYFLPSP